MGLFKLDGKTALLTGAAGFFGSYFAKVLLEYGARVVLIDKDFGKLNILCNELSSKYPTDRIKFYAVDQYSKYAEHTFRQIEEDENIDILINNAFDFSERTGFNTPTGQLEYASYEQLSAAFQSGVYWSILTTQIFGLAMKSRGSGSIINICSMYSVIVPSPDLYQDTEKFNPPGYSMTKAGLMQFTRYAASFLGPEVRVNALSPGAIPNTEIGGDNAIEENHLVLERLKAKTILKKMGHPTDLIGAIIFLASDASSYMTGQNIIIDGGLTVL